MGAIDWSRLTQPLFDRIVEAFILKDNADLPHDAYAVNGRGGDDGIDIRITRDGRLRILQLKYFPEGFSGGFRETRQDQILASFKSALKHDPDEWHLVVPSTLTKREREYVVGLPLRQNPRRARPEVFVFDRPKLDRLAARHPGLVEYFQRDDQLLEAARLYKQERSLLVHQNDLVARVAALKNRADSLHPDWRLDFFAQGDVVGTTVVARHPYAAERSPIKLSISATFGPDQGELREAFERAMAYGTPERIELPPSVISKFAIDGPEFLAHTSDNVAVTLLPTRSEAIGRRVSLVFYSDRDLAVASFLGKITWTGSAQAGVSLRASFYDAVNLEFLLPFDKSATGRMGVDTTLTGSEPNDVLRAVKLLEHLDSAHSLGVEIEDAELGRLQLSEGSKEPFAEDRVRLATHKAIAADLVAVQDATSRYFPYPDEVEFLDWIYLRCLRLLLEGKCVVLPGKRKVNVELNGEDGEPVRQLLSGDLMSIAVELSGFELEIFGHSISIGPARAYAPQVAAVDPANARQALDAGTANGYNVTLRARDGYGFWLFIPERFETADGTVRPVSLDLPGFDDAPDVARAIEATEQMSHEARPQIPPSAPPDQ